MVVVVEVGGVCAVDQLLLLLLWPTPNSSVLGVNMNIPKAFVRQ